MRESYVEGTTFSGGLPSYVSNRLVDKYITMVRVDIRICTCNNFQNKPHGQL